MFSCAVGREEHCNQISLCVGSTCSVLATLGLPLLTVCVLSQSTLFRLQVALQGNCLKWALGCVHFPGVSCSGSGSQVLCKGTDSVGPAFCALPTSEQLRRPGTWRAHPRQVGSTSYHLPVPVPWFPGCAVEAPSRCTMCLFWGSNLCL